MTTTPVWLVPPPDLPVADRQSRADLRPGGGGWSCCHQAGGGGGAGCRHRLLRCQAGCGDPPAGRWPVLRV